MGWRKRLPVNVGDCPRGRRAAQRDVRGARTAKDPGKRDELGADGARGGAPDRGKRAFVDAYAAVLEHALTTHAGRVKPDEVKSIFLTCVIGGKGRARLSLRCAQGQKWDPPPLRAEPICSGSGGDRAACHYNAPAYDESRIQTAEGGKAWSEASTNFCCTSSPARNVPHASGWEPGKASRCANARKRE